MYLSSFAHNNNSSFPIATVWRQMGIVGISLNSSLLKHFVSTKGRIFGVVNDVNACIYTVGLTLKRSLQLALTHTHGPRFVSIFNDLHRLNLLIFWQLLHGLCHPPPCSQSSPKQFYCVPSVRRSSKPLVSSLQLRSHYTLH